MAKHKKNFFILSLSLSLISLPNHQQWYAKWKLIRNIYTLHTRFCTFGADLYAQTVLINKIFAFELSWKFIKSTLLVGYLPSAFAYHPSPI